MDAALLEHEAQHPAQLQHVGRLQVLGHVDQRLPTAVTANAQLAGARQRLQQPVSHLFHVTAAFLQVGILDDTKLRHQFLGRLGNGPFDVEPLVLDPGLGPFDQRRIVQQHQLHVQERPGLGRCISRQLGGHALQLGLDHSTAFAQSGPFARHLPGGDVVARHIDERGIQHTGLP